MIVSRSQKKQTSENREEKNRFSSFCFDFAQHNERSFVQRDSLLLTRAEMNFCRSQNGVFRMFLFRLNFVKVSVGECEINELKCCNEVLALCKNWTFAYFCGFLAVKAN